MNNIGAETYSPPNGYRDPGMHGGIHRDEDLSGSKGTASAQASKTQASQQGQQDDSINLAKILSFAKDMQKQVKDIPYIVPIAVGGVAFTLGVLASSRILRQVVFMAGSYGLKQAIAAAPKDQIMDFAKKAVIDAIKRQMVG
jgi:hypothetical protein